MPKKRMAKAKAVNYVLIPQTGEIGAPMYERLYRLIDQYHDDLSKTQARVALAWQLGIKPDVDGRLVLGKCRKATDLDRELAPWDFVILLNRDFWQHAQVTDLQRDALLDHELHHAALAYDEDGDFKRDERGRYVFRTRRHDIEEFQNVVARYGLYKNDLVDFERALRKAAAKSDGWIGYSKLQDTLAAVGIDLPKTVIATWTDDERREVLTWSLVRADQGVQVNVSTAQTIPVCLARALAEKHDPPAPPTNAVAH